MRHFALIPAKENSTRLANKNWRTFNKEGCLVDLVFKTIPPKFFNSIIVSTDKKDYKAPSGIERHLRHKSLSQKDSPAEDLLQVIIREYEMRDEDYIWMLNPTTPFRTRDDYGKIARIIRNDAPQAIISAVRIHPFIWKDKMPQYETKGKRRNTQDFKEEYFVENGMFFVANVGSFRKNNSWHCGNVMLYKQDKIWCFVDIDTEDNFVQAQKIYETFFAQRGENA